MSNSKIDFISELLVRENVKPAAKKRLFALTGQELKTMDTGREEIIKRLNEVEENIVKRLEKEGSVSENKEIDKVQIDLSKHKPLDITTFLSIFKTGYGLKFLTHAYDVPGSVFKRTDILQAAKKEFDDQTKKLSIKWTLKARIKKFAFGIGEKDWFFNGQQYQLNWESKEVIDWCNDNPGLHPIDNETFYKEMIKPFKESIEIKTQEPTLETLIKQKVSLILNSDFSSFKIDFIDLKKASFFTDVDSVLYGIGHLLRGIKQRKENSKHIKFEYIKKGRIKILKIVHIGSECDKQLTKEELLGGDLRSAEKAFYCVCDWSIISRSKSDGMHNKLNILFEINDNIPERETIDEPIEGFTHVLTFKS